MVEAGVRAGRWAVFVMAAAFSVFGLSSCGPSRSAGGAPQLTPAQACLESLGPAKGIDVC